MAQSTATLQVPQDPAFLELVGQFVTFCARQVGFDERDAARIRLAVDEACANVLLHGTPSTPGDSYRVVCEESLGGLTIRVQDTAPMFDLGGVPEPDIAAPLEKRKIGGLGVYFMRQIMDSVELREMPDGKELVLTKRLGTEARDGG